MPLEHSLKNMETIIKPWSIIIANNRNLKHKDSPLVSEPFLPLPFWLSQLKKPSSPPPPIISVSLAVEALWNSHHIKHLSASHFTSGEIPPLTVHPAMLSSCNILSQAILLSPFTDEASHNCLMQTQYILTPCSNLQKTQINADLSWFTGFMVE